MTRVMYFFCSALVHTTAFLDGSNLSPLSASIKSNVVGSLNCSNHLQARTYHMFLLRTISLSRVLGLSHQQHRPSTAAGPLPSPSGNSSEVGGVGIHLSNKFLVDQVLLELMFLGIGDLFPPLPFRRR